jgi:hypothetical protein
MNFINLSTNNSLVVYIKHYIVLIKVGDAHMSTIKKANRLLHEKSPYLLQHAYNPVDWFPWCDEAFEKAKSEDKPIFLSIGYS